jgi:hypothetical protein
MIDPTANELKAMEMSSERAGEYLGWLKKTDMAEFSKKEWSDLIEVIVTGYFEGMQNLADLDLPEHLGNCVTCWKKSDRKLLTIAKENPSAFDFMDRMEKTYSCHGPGGKAAVFFRNHRSAQEMLALSKMPFKPFVPGAFQMEMFDPELDMQSACGESCEVGADEIGV